MGKKRVPDRVIYICCRCRERELTNLIILILTKTICLLSYLRNSNSNTDIAQILEVVSIFELYFYSSSSTSDRLVYLYLPHSTSTSGRGVIVILIFWSFHALG